MTQTLRLTLDVETPNVSGLDDVTSGLDRATDGVDRFDQVSTGAFERIGHRITDLGVNLAQQGISQAIELVGDSITLASDKAEAASKVNVLYGESADQIVAASEGAAQAVGMSSGAYLTAAGDLGNLLTNFDITGDAAAGMSQDMITLAADVGSFNNADPTEVIQAMGAAFRGESEPIRQFGVMLDEASIKQEAMALGLYDGVGALDASARAQATYSLILDQTAAAQGDFARTSDGLANQQRIAAAEQEEAWTRLGEALLPIALVVTPLISDAISGLADVMGVVFGLIMDNAPAVGAAVGAIGIVVAATVVPPFIAWAAATLAATWPLIALGAAVAGVVFVLDKLGILRVLIDLFGRMADVLMGGVRLALDVVGGAIGTLGNIFGSVFGRVRGVLDGFLGTVRNVVDGATSVFQGIGDFLGRLWSTIGRGLSVLGDTFGRIFDGISDTVDGAIDAVLGVFASLWSGISRVGGQISSFLGGIFRPFSDAFNRAVGIVRDGWNAFARFWNSVGINIPEVHIPDPFGGGGITLGGGRFTLPQLPILGQGGIVTSPTVALIGDVPEAVIPLDRLRGQGSGPTVNIYAGVGDPVEIGRQVVEAIRSYERANGPAF